VGAWGDLGHNAVRGPGEQVWNLSLFKNFVFNEARGSQFELRLETFNTFNHTQWQYVNAFCSGATPFGSPCNGANNVGNGEVTGAWAPRLVQLGLKLMF
jgi:hypothetical protein